MPQRKSPKESSIVRAILDDLRSRGRAVWFRKNHGGPFGFSGVPDIEVVFRHRNGLEPAIVVFLEVKKPGERPTAIQEATMEAIRNAGAFVAVVHSKKEAIDYLESLGIPPRLENQCPTSSELRLSSSSSSSSSGNVVSSRAAR
jgi:hypothetical protein